MGFEIVEYMINLSREEVVKLLIDNENLETKTVDGERVILMGSGTHKKVANQTKDGFINVFVTNVDFVDQDRYLWSTVSLTKKDDQSYIGTITPNSP